MVLGAVPLVARHGGGDGIAPADRLGDRGRNPARTFLTLLVVPTAYTLLARRHRTFEERLEKDRADNEKQVHQPAAGTERETRAQMERPREAALLHPATGLSPAASGSDDKVDDLGT